MIKQRKIFSKDFSGKLVLGTIEALQIPGGLAEKYAVHTSQITTWMK